MFLSTSNREFLYILETIERGFTSKSVRDMIYLSVLFCQFKMSMNVKELLARSRRDIRSLSDCNGTRTHNHLVKNEHSTI